MLKRGVQVCPVCNTFAHRDPAALSAHIDDCLSGNTDASPAKGNQAPAASAATAHVSSLPNLKPQTELPNTPTIFPCMQPVTPPGRRPLAGVVVFVDARSEFGDLSGPIAAQVTALGGETSASFSPSVTHVVFKNGKKATADRAVKRALPMVSIAWIEKCKEDGRLVDAAPFAVDGNASTPIRPSMAPTSIQDSAERGVGWR